MSECIPYQDGVAYIQWIYYISGNCVYGNQAASSLVLGYMSIVFWLHAQLPQIIENFKKSSAEGLSPSFLTVWFFGDVTNLIGCLLTNQLPFQTYLSMYFVSVDIALVCQWVYYTKIQRRAPTQRETKPISPIQHPSVATPLLIDVKGTDSDTDSENLLPNSVSASPNKWYTMESTKPKKLYALMLFGTTLSFGTLSSSPSSSSATATISTIDTYTIGMIIAYVCTFLYLFSRIPQIRKNYRRRSVEGLSVYMFLCAAGGNLTYFTSVMILPGQTKESLLNALPYLLGSAGTLGFDAAIVTQFLWYRRRKNYRMTVTQVV